MQAARERMQQQEQQRRSREEAREGGEGERERSREQDSSVSSGGSRTVACGKGTAAQEGALTSSSPGAACRTAFAMTDYIPSLNSRQRLQRRTALCRRLSLPPSPSPSHTHSHSQADTVKQASGHMFLSCLPQRPSCRRRRSRGLCP